MGLAVDLLSVGNDLQPRSGPSNPNTATRPPVYKVIGICLAIAAGVFIGSSFVLKKLGLLKANVKYNEEAGEGYGYLRNLWWWSGMILMILGELMNFAAYAFVDAILVTPLGALSVVITTILSAIFLKERLSFVGKVGCFICIVGSVVIVINAPAQSSAATIQQMQHFVIAPGFLSYAGVVIVGCAFIAIWAGPRYGKKSMLVYLSICSFIGGLSVVATQGLGAAIVTQAAGTPQFNQWFLYVLLVFVIATLVTEIIYLNKALNLYNAALVTPTYYVFFTSATIVTSAILFRGFKGTPGSIATVVMGFLQICAGVILLQLSKSAKDVPDAAVFKGDLDQVRTVAEQKDSEYEPKADAIRGAAAVIRRISLSRQKMEVEEAKRLHEERLRDLEPIGEGEQFEWDGIRRRRTTSGGSASLGSLKRTKTRHPPLGMSHFTHDSGDYDQDSSHGGQNSNSQRHMRPVPLTTTSTVPPHEQDDQAEQRHQGYPNVPPMHELHAYDPGMAHSGRMTPRQNPPIRWAPEVGMRTQSPDTPPKPPPHAAKRQFSFQNVFHRNRDLQPQTHDGAADERPRSRLGLGSRQGSHFTKVATEEEELGLVQGDSSTNHQQSLPTHVSSEEEDEGWREADKSEWSKEDEKESELRRWSGGSSDSNHTSTRPPQQVRESRDFPEWEGRSETGGAFM
ncbi:MAG: hypothetical protein M1816_002475 [Peltula sp. TS41687]|nr:MAG: hypothetical protein M1816_002475 [Peltula sp. TS41687]